MSEGLEALERLVYAITHEVNAYSQYTQSQPFIDQDKALVEKELKEYEQHKAIEQELGINLVKLSQIRKAIIKKEKCYIVGWNDKIWIYRLEEIDIVNNLVIGIYDGCRHSEELKDYGKTWALTKEELE